jgi:hypothetical protein
MDLAERYYKAGVRLVAAQLYEQAEAAFKAALANSPGHARARWGLAHALLGMGRYAEGWPLLRSRFVVARGEVKPASAVLPEWEGQPLAGKTLAVVYEQGFGDQIMMARFLPQIRAAGATVMLTIRPPLVNLLAPLADCVVPIELGQRVATPPYDYWTHFFTLPERLGVSLATLPSAPYLGTAEGGAGRGGIGLFWRTGDEGRSLPATEAQRLLSYGLVSLQPEDTGAKDFAETASIIQHMSLVVTIDTAVAHLAGALGKPVWVLLPSHGVDWRWMRHREDSPWYPTARLFRGTPGDSWANVVDRVLASLR